MSDVTDPLMPLSEAGAALGMHPSTASRRAKAGTFPVEVLYIGRFPKVRRADFERLLSGEPASEPEPVALAVVPPLFRGEAGRTLLEGLRDLCEFGLAAMDAAGETHERRAS